MEAVLITVDAVASRIRLLDDPAGQREALRGYAALPYALCGSVVTGPEEDAGGYGDLAEASSVTPSPPWTPHGLSTGSRRRNCTLK